MTRDEAIGFHRQLEALLARAPGDNDEEVRHQVQRMRFACRPAPDGQAYLREKILDACESLDTWLNPRKLPRQGEDHATFQHIIRTNVYKVHRAIETTSRGQTTGGSNGETR